MVRWGLPIVRTLHDLAASEPLRLSPENVLGYLKFFCFFVRGDEGAFYILEQADDPMVPADIDEGLRRALIWYRGNRTAEDS